MTRSLQETTKDSVPLGVNKSESVGWASKKPTRKSLLKRNGHFAITVAKHLKKASIGGFSLCRIKSGNNKDRVFKGQLDRIREAEGTSILKPIQPSDGELIKQASTSQINPTSSSPLPPCFSKWVRSGPPHRRLRRQNRSKRETTPSLPSTTV